MVNIRDADAAGRAHAPLKAYSDSTERYTGALFCMLNAAAKLRVLSRCMTAVLLLIAEPMRRRPPWGNRRARGLVAGQHARIEWPGCPFQFWVAICIVMYFEVHHLLELRAPCIWADIGIEHNTAYERMWSGNLLHGKPLVGIESYCITEWTEMRA